MAKSGTGRSLARDTFSGRRMEQALPGPMNRRLSDVTSKPSPAVEGGESNNIAISHDQHDLRERRSQAARNGQAVALVPTMGALHEGHEELIRHAAQHCDEIYVSIFVNPTQFGVNEDLKSYPQTWEADLARLRRLNEALKEDGNVRGRITVVFKPETKVMYPGLPPTSEIDGEGSFVIITPIGRLLEGASRPVFFRGVATVVMKLLNIVQPDLVIFGQKDIQQLILIKRMIEDFHINTTLKMVPTVREPDGLAQSSRNVYLGSRRRMLAPVLYYSLKSAEDMFEKHSKRGRGDVIEAALQIIEKAQKEQQSLNPAERARFELDYISLADPRTMEEVDVIDNDLGAVLSAAIVMAPLEEGQPGEERGLGGGQRQVRLIDNLLLGQAQRTIQR